MDILFFYRVLTTFMEIIILKSQLNISREDLQIFDNFFWIHLLNREEREEIPELINLKLQSISIKFKKYMSLNTDIFTAIVEKVQVYRVDSQILNLKQSYKIFVKEILEEQLYIILLAIEKEIQNLQLKTESTNDIISTFNSLLYDRFFPGFNDIYKDNNNNPMIFSHGHNTFNRKVFLERRSIPRYIQLTKKMQLLDRVTYT